MPDAAFQATGQERVGVRRAQRSRLCLFGVAILLGPHSYSTRRVHAVDLPVVQAASPSKVGRGLGAGRCVLGTTARANAQLIRPRAESGSASYGVTPGHLLRSLGRSAWVRADRLGTRQVLTPDGPGSVLA